MKRLALRVGVCCFATLLLAGGCDGSGSGKSQKDGGDTEAGKPIDVARDVGSGKDTAVPRSDARDTSPPIDVRAPDGVISDLPIVPPLDGPVVVVDGAEADAVVDAPITNGGEAGGHSEAGSSATVDGPVGEAGILPPLVFPDGGLTCGLAGDVCQSAADCCGLACVSNRCSA